MNKAKLINIDVYDVPVFYLVSTWKQCVKVLKKDFNYDVNPKQNGNGFAVQISQKNSARGVFIWIDNCAGLDVAIHEFFHASVYILCDFCGIRLSDTSEEAFAYLISYIVKEFIKDGRTVKQIKRKRK